MVKLAGIHFDYNDAYTPVTVGKKNKVVAPRHIWGLSFREINFTNEEELRALTPETVSIRQCYFPNQDGSFSPIDGKLAVVGDESNTPYAIHSNKYEPIQHNVIINAMADAISDTELNMFGHFDNDKGRFNGYGTFANPDCHINVGDKHDDPIMLGMRFFNSHNGDSKFGGEIFGIDYINIAFHLIGSQSCILMAARHRRRNIKMNYIIAFFGPLFKKLLIIGNGGSGSFGQLMIFGNIRRWN